MHKSACNSIINNFLTSKRSSNVKSNDTLFLFLFSSNKKNIESNWVILQFQIYRNSELFFFRFFKNVQIQKMKNHSSCETKKNELFRCLILLNFFPFWNQFAEKWYILKCCYRPSTTTIKTSHHKCIVWNGNKWFFYLFPGFFHVFLFIEVVCYA